jgi:translation initiation factor 1A
MIPRGNEVIGTVSKISGASKFLVSCTDGNERLCSIPGRFRRRFWIKINDVVLVKPWVVQSNERGDIIWRYTPMDVNRLKGRKLIQ